MDFSEQWGHMDIEDRFCEKVKFFIFETASTFRDSCAYKLNNTTTPPPNTITRAIFQVVQRGQSLINSMSSSLFCVIVDVVEVEVGRRLLLIIDFRDFQELKVHRLYRIKIQLVSKKLLLPFSNTVSFYVFLPEERKSLTVLKI